MAKKISKTNIDQLDLLSFVKIVEKEDEKNEVLKETLNEQSDNSIKKINLNSSERNGNSGTENKPIHSEPSKLPGLSSNVDSKRLAEISPSDDNVIFNSMPNRGKNHIEQFNKKSDAISSIELSDRGRESSNIEDIATSNNKETSMLVETSRLLEGETDSSYEGTDTGNSVLDFTNNISHSYNKHDEPYIKFENFKVSFAASLNAYKLLKELHKSFRLATKEEKTILSQYVGFKYIFNIENVSKLEKQEALKQLQNEFSESECNELLKSSTNPHNCCNFDYGFIGQILEKSKLNELLKYKKKIKILNPCCGIGEFISNLPSTYKENAIIHGYEQDNIAFEISKYLHQGQNIYLYNESLQELNTNFNKYDLVVGAFPYGSTNNTVQDVYSDIANYQVLHSYYIAKSLHALNAGGIFIGLAPRNFIQTQNQKLISAISNTIDFKHIFLLPKEILNLKDVHNNYDILVFQKKPNNILEPKLPPFQYQLGNQIGFCQTYGVERYTIDPRSYKPSAPDFSYKDFFPRITEEITKGIEKSFINPDYHFKSLKKSDINQLPNEEIIAKSKQKVILAPNNMMIGELFVENENIYIVIPSLSGENTITQIKLPTDEAKKTKLYIKIKETLKTLTYMEIKNNSEKIDLEKQREKLRTFYNEFVSNYGKLNDTSNSKLLKLDVKSFFVRSLEKVDKMKKTIVNADILHKRVYNAKTQEIKTIPEIVFSSIAEKGRIDIEYISTFKGFDFNNDPEITLEKLLETKLIIKNPFTNSYELMETFVSGEIGKKLNALENIKSNLLQGEYHSYKKLLKNALPEQIKITDIHFSLTTPWVNNKIKKEILNSILKDDVIDKILYCEETASYSLKTDDTKGIKSVMVYEYGTSRMPAVEILKKIFSYKDLKVLDVVKYTDSKGKLSEKLEINTIETSLAQDKAEILEKEFVKHVLENKTYCKIIEKEYNRIFNSSKATVYKYAELLEFPTISPEIKLRPHQKRAVLKGILENRYLLDHVVGSGKTYSLAVTIMERKRLGLDTKPLLIVPKNLIGQWERDFLKIYPNANLLVATEKNFNPSSKAEFIRNACFNNWDCIIMSHSSFTSLSLSTLYTITSIESNISAVEEIIDFNTFHKRPYAVKQNKSIKSALEKKLEEIVKNNKQDEISFDFMQIDSLYVDEAHEFKNVPFSTKHDNISGINPTGSKKAHDFYAKASYVKRNREKRTNQKDTGLFFATGTPISNSLGELYVFSLILSRTELINRWASHFDSWSSTFTKIESKYQVDSTGKGFQHKKMFSLFKNIPELSTMYNIFADVVVNEDIKGFVKIPELENNSPTKIVIPSTSQQKDFMEDLIDRVVSIKKNLVHPKFDNMLKITSDAKKASIDLRLIDPTKEPSNKIAKASEIIYETYKKWDIEKGTQLVFSDIGVFSEEKIKKFNVYAELTTLLIQKGIAPKEIAFVQLYKSEKAKESLFEKVRKGDIRVLLGSTQTLGTGVNVQSKLVAVHHLDVPWRPSDLEQREGRILRQGNLFLEKNPNFKVNIYRYATEGTFDSRSWQILETKATFIGQFKQGTVKNRTGLDISYDEEIKNSEEMKAISSDNPYFSLYIKLKNDYKKEKEIFDQQSKNIIKMKKEILDFDNKEHEEYNKSNNKILRYSKILIENQNPIFLTCIANEDMKPGFVYYEKNTNIILYHDKERLSFEKTMELQEKFPKALEKAIIKEKEKKTKIETDISNMRKLANFKPDDNNIRHTRNILVKIKLELDNYTVNKSNLKHIPYIPALPQYKRDIENIVTKWKETGHKISMPSLQKNNLFSL